MIVDSSDSKYLVPFLVSLCGISTPRIKYLPDVSCAMTSCLESLQIETQIMCASNKTVAFQFCHY